MGGTMVEEAENGEGEHESKCPHCGAKMVEYRRCLNRELVQVLRKFYDRFRSEPGILSDVELSHSERNNFPKLSYWNFVEPHVTDDNSHKRGWWRVTTTGWLFLEGKFWSPVAVYTLHGKATRFDNERKSVEIIEPSCMLHDDYADDECGFRFDT
jgi:hypothetical protein